MFVMGWWGSALCRFFLCFRACLSGTLLAAAAEGKEKCDWVCTGLNSPAGVCPQVTTGLFSQSPGPTQPQSQESRPAQRREGKGRKCAVLESCSLEHPAFPPNRSPDKCHLFQEALPAHLGPGCGEAYGCPHVSTYDGNGLCQAWEDNSILGTLRLKCPWGI